MIIQNKTFVPLHVHSMYSRLIGGDGFCFPRELAQRAKDIGCPAIALTDHGTLAGTTEFYRDCKKIGIKPVLGMEGYITPMGHSLDERIVYDVKDMRGKPGYVRNNYHINLWAKDEAGWRSLMELSKQSFAKGYYYKPRIDHDLLMEHHEGLICGSACVLGEIASMGWCGDYAKARETAQWYQELFGEDYYLEVMYHGLDMERAALAPVRDIAKELGIKVIATNDSHYAVKEEYKLHKALMLDKMHKSFADKDVSGSFFGDDDEGPQTEVEEDGGDSNPIFETSSELYIKDWDEMVASLALEGATDDDVAVELANTLEVAEKCNYDLPLIDMSDPNAYYVPIYPVEKDLQYDAFANSGFEIRQSTIDAIVEEMHKGGYEGERLEDFLNDHEMLSLRFLMWMCDEGLKKNVVPKLEARGEALPMEFWCDNPPDGFEIRHTHNSPDELWIREQMTKGLSVDDMIKIYQDRIDYEVAVVVRKRFIDYFSVVQNYANFTKMNGSVMGPGRGSGGGSLLLYLLSITSIDPIPNKLLFFRFLNPDRNSVPDVDLDFSATFRDGVLKPYLKEFYGDDYCASVATYMFYWGKAAIKAAARILFPMPDSVQIGTVLTEALDDKPKLDLNKELDGSNPDFEQLVNSRLEYKQTVELAKMIQGRLSGESIHASAYIVSPKKLTDFVPLSVTKDERTRAQKEGTEIKDYLIQLDGTSASEFGLVKLDLLCVVDLEMMEMTCNTIERIYGCRLNLERIPLDDASIWSMLNEHLVSGLFQLDGSEGMARVMDQVRPENIENINAIVALYRPGPMDYIPNYVDGKNHPEHVHYLDDRLEPILRDTYGVVCYQEQSMQITQVIGGFSGGDADAYRKASAKKHPEQLVPMGKQFVEGALENNTSQEVAEELWTQLVKFGSYAFNRSHSAAYALIAYRGAFLKAHFPECFFASLCTLKPKAKKTNKVPEYLDEARQMGVTVKPPHVNYSESGFDVPEKGVIAFGLGGIGGVGAAAKVIVEERHANGPFKDFSDFMTRVPRTVGKGALLPLMTHGALDGLGWSRRAMVESIDQIIEFRKKYFASQEQRKNLAVDLFSLGAAPDAPEDDGSEILLTPPFETEYNQRQMLEMEKRNFGTYLSGSPEEYRKLSRYSTELAIGKSYKEAMREAMAHAKSAGAAQRPPKPIHVGDINEYRDFHRDNGTPVEFLCIVSDPVSKNRPNPFMFRSGKGCSVNIQDWGVLEESRVGFSPRIYKSRLTIFSRLLEQIALPQPGDLLHVVGKINIDKTGEWPNSVIVDKLDVVPDDNRLLETMHRDDLLALKARLERVSESMGDPASDMYMSMLLEFPSQDDLEGFTAAVKESMRGTGHVLLSVAGEGSSPQDMALRPTIHVANLAKRFGAEVKKFRLPKAQAAIDRRKLMLGGDNTDSAGNAGVAKTASD